MGTEEGADVTGKVGAGVTAYVGALLMSSSESKPVSSWNFFPMLSKKVGCIVGAAAGLGVGLELGGCGVGLNVGAGVG